MEQGGGDQFFLDLGTRIREMEERQQLVKDRTMLIGKSMIDLKDKISSEIREMRKTIFVLQQEKLEATRKIIEATGARDAQLIQAQGLTPEILKMRSIDAFDRLSKSPNAKIIITDGKIPFLVKE